MKKITATLTLTLGFAVLFSTAVQATNPIQFSEEFIVERSELSLESKIEVQDWMLTFENVSVVSEKSTEDEIRLEDWMINNSWNYDASQDLVSETEIQLEDWMTKSFKKDTRILAHSGPMF